MSEEFAPEATSQDEGAKSHQPGWILRSKLDAPRILIEAVDRRELWHLRDKVLSYTLTSVTAPAGFGKTTLVTQWRSDFLSMGHKVAWLTLDEADGEPSQLLSYIIVALSKAGLDVGQLELLAEQGLFESSVEMVTDSLTDVIARQKAPVVVILDDFHRIDAEPALHLVRQMIRIAPDNFHLLINSRYDVSLSLPEFIASGKAQDLRASQLRFNLEETSKAIGDGTQAEAIKALYEKTEGWPVAVQLAKLVLAHHHGKGEFAKFVSGQTGHLSTYLAEQVISGLEEAQIDFLAKTSILERFDPALANEVCGISDSGQLIDSLESLNALLVPIGTEGAWYRYHHLFADFLKDLLDRDYPDQKQALHRKAADWFEAEGLISEAVRHAKLAGDIDRAAHIIEHAGGYALILYGGIGFLRNLLGNLSRTEIGRYPRLLLARAYLHIKDGNIAAARRYYEDALALSGLSFSSLTDFSSMLNQDVLNLTMLLEVYEDNLREASKLHEMQHYRSILPAGHALTEGVVASTLTLTEIAHGQMNNGLATIRQGMRAMRQADSILGLNYCYLHSGLSDFYLGNIQNAEASLWEAKELASDNFGADSGLHAMVNVLLGGVEYWRGSKNDSSALKQSFLSATKHVEQFDGWFEIYAMSLDVHLTAALSQNDIQQARQITDRLDVVFNNRNIRRLGYLVAAARLRIAVAENCLPDIERYVGQLLEDFPLACWKKTPYLWRPYQSVGIALVEAEREANRATALERIEDMLECVQHFSASFFLTSLNLHKALVLDQMGDREKAVEAVELALETALAQGIHRPFTLMPDMLPLLQAVMKLGREEVWSARTVAFLNSCIAEYQSTRFSGEAAEEFGLSKRELDVLDKLVSGITNKEIARALDMTENTVKYHLKNLFRKLSAENRQQAIDIAKESNIIT